MPSTIVRASENGRPFLPVGRGSIPSINDHWASDSNWNRDTDPASQPNPEPFVRHALATAVLNRCDWFVTLDKDYQKVTDLRVFSIYHLRDGPAALPWDLPGQDPLFDPQSNVMPISSPKR